MPVDITFIAKSLSTLITAAWLNPVNRLVNDLPNTTDAAKGAGLVPFNYDRTYAPGTIGGVAKAWGIDMTQPPFSCDKTGVADCAAAITSALTTYPGVPLKFPKGTYRVDSTVTIKPAPSWGVFGPGARIQGDGVGATFFDTRAANLPLFDIDSDTHGGTFHANMGTVLTGFNIINSTAAASTVGIRVLNGYQVDIIQVVIKGMTSHGIELKNGLYADDGWNRVNITQVWIDSCAGWGIKADGSAARNEGSYTYLQNVFFQTNGTASAATPPPSGGMIWKGQVLVMESCGFATGNQNVGLFVKGESGLANTVDLRNTTFENCVKRGLYVTGISNLRGRNLQFYNNDTYQATKGCEFDGTTYTIRQVDIDGVVVRATSGNNAYTAFTASGANLDTQTFRVRNVVWDNFDFSGQTRFSGVSFAPIEMQAQFDFSTSTTCKLEGRQVNGTGASLPLRLRGGNGGVASASGEWVPYLLLSTGITVTNASLANSTQYYAYFYDNAGAAALALSTVAPQIDTATGYWVNSGTFATTVLVGQALCVGAIMTDNAAAFLTLPGAVDYSASITPNAAIALFPGVSNGQWTITASNGTAFTINAPTNPSHGQIVTLTIRNASGGALGVITWNAVFKMSAWTNPANGQSRSITFRYDKTNWVQVGQTGVDVPN
jgi:hypothetical protein